MVSQWEHSITNNTNEKALLFVNPYKSVSFVQFAFYLIPRLSAGLLGASLLLCAPQLAAKTLKLRDQLGQPIVNAVVAITSDDKTPSTEQPVAVMDQLNKKFVPRVLTIKQGQQVSFPNSDDIRHHVYSFSATKPFEIKLFKGLVTEPIVFDKAGIVVLGCNIHDEMIGYIYVAKDEITFISDDKGEVVIPDTSNQIYLWHENLSAHNTQRETLDISGLQPDPDDGSILVTVSLLQHSAEHEPEPKSSSKFKKKFN